MTTDPFNVVCAVGTWDSFDDLAELVDDVGGGLMALDRSESVLQPVPGIGRAFDLAADRVRPSFEAEDRAAVAAHTSVAFVVSGALPPDDAADRSRVMLRMVSALFGLGGAGAVKCESSGIAHGRAWWLELARLAAGASPGREEALVRAWVRLPLVDGTTYYSCGMHLLGRPDVEVPAGEPVDLAVPWMDGMCRRLLDPAQDRVSSGSVLQVEGMPPRRADRTPPGRHDPGDLFHNPYGYLRLSGA